MAPGSPLRALSLSQGDGEEHRYQRNGWGLVPALPTLAAAAQELVEAIPDGGFQAWIHKGMARELDFTEHGVDVEDVRKAFKEVLDAARRMEPVVESGNKYGVSPDFHRINSELIMHQLKNTEMFESLKPEDQQRSEDMFNLVFQNDELRNRNPLHPSILDSCIIGNLLNFPKHIFGFPFASYATDGNESLSLVLYSYRLAWEERPRKQPCILYVGSDKEYALADIQLCVERLGMEFVIVSDSELSNQQSQDRIVAVVTSLESPSLGETAKWCGANQIALHLHIRDGEFRNIFANKKPVHFDLPRSIKSISIEEGLLNSGYSLYRDSRTRDRHLDVGLAWQTAYMSPNEGGSGQSAPLLMDFCCMLLGWEALHHMAQRDLGFRNPDRSSYRLQPTLVPRHRRSIVEVRGKCSMEEILTWARESTDRKAGCSREELETELVCFQREFLGGKGRDVEALVTGGGSRSINLAFESVIKRARPCVAGPLKVVIGNPHLAVERAERRFGFEVVRVDIDGAICIEQLEQELNDPAVVAVYSQTLSYTDGISDPLAEIVKLIEAQNQKRTDAGQSLPITLINDSCLAFAVLVCNDGSSGANNMRVLDLTENLNIPTIVTLDAHKHLGTDKGVSTVVGSKGTLSNLKDHIRVGSQPSREELVRAIANVWTVGKDGYYRQYQELSVEVERVVQTVESVGMTIVHARNRIKGSTVIGVEDPSGPCMKMLAKKGHLVTKLFGLCRHDSSRCQTGWQVSFTPYSLRQVAGKLALDVFRADIEECSKKLKQDTKLALSRRFFRENSLPAFLISGNTDPYVLQMIQSPGWGREFALLIIRRFFTQILDCGIVRTQKRPALKPLLSTVKRLLAVAVAFVALLLVRRRHSMHKMKNLAR